MVQLNLVESMDMKRFFLLCFLTGIFAVNLNAQSKNYAPSIEPCNCPVKIDSNYQTECGFLLVPENRKKKNSRIIKLPYIISKSKNPNKRKDPFLYSAGGPGGSSLGWITSVGRRPFIEDRDCIAFEQRGTRYAIPTLWSQELAETVKESYRKNLPKDSMMLVGAKKFKKALEAKGIDLSGYNTDETVADIHDLLKVLRIDSINLLGISYGGGLMLAVLQKDPSKVRSLVLDSPLPTFVPIDEEEPANFNEALSILLKRCARDSSDKALYGDIQEKFNRYFTSINGKVFSVNYIEPGSSTMLNIEYTSSELINVLVNDLYDVSKWKDIPFMILDMINGNHQPYVKQTLDGVFRDNVPSGMRISVYCADQTAYHDEAVLKQLYDIYPWMRGYHINDVYREICDCWNVPPINPKTKEPFHSNKPVLLADGELDPACRPIYIDMIHHYMPNSQRLLFKNRAHGVLGGSIQNEIIRSFLNNPFKKIELNEKDVIVY